MIEKTQAITLRYAPSGNTSRIVTWLTPDFGRVSTLIKGALRPKSAFIGQYDTFYTCELLFYARQRNELHFAKECSPMKLRTALRHDWRACAAASYLTDLALRAGPAQAPQRFLFYWLDQALDALPGTGVQLQSIIFWHELKLLNELGLAPRLSSCLQCHCDLAPGSAARFSHERGGLLCPACAQQDHRPATPIPPDALAILRRWQRAPAITEAQRTRCTPQQLIVLERLLGEFLRYHLDLALNSRDVSLSIIKRPSGSHGSSPSRSPRATGGSFSSP